MWRHSISPDRVVPLIGVSFPTPKDGRFDFPGQGTYLGCWFDSGCVCGGECMEGN